ncbi:MAG: NADH pyrophosphatase, partial [Pseudomonadota bacterium]
MIPESEVTFAGSFLDRADHLRGDDAEMTRRLADPATLVIPFWRGKPLFDLHEAGPRLSWVSAQDALVTDGPEAPIFMGLSDDGLAHFAAD